MLASKACKESYHYLVCQILPNSRANSRMFTAIYVDKKKIQFDTPMHIKIVNPQMHNNHSQINRISTQHLFLGDLPFECFLLGDDVTKQCFILSLPGRVPVNQPPLTDIYSVPRLQCNSRTLLHMLLENNGELCIAMTGFIFQRPHYFCIFGR